MRAIDYLLNEIKGIPNFSKDENKPLKEYTVWEEGYLATGMEGVPAPASCLGTFQARSFKEACYLAAFEHDSLSLFDAKDLTIWGCRLFDNEQRARRSYG